MQTRRLIQRFAVTAAVLTANAQMIITIDPDANGINNEENISTFFSGVTLSAIGGSGSDGSVYALENQDAPTPDKVFAWFDGNFLDDHWGRTGSPAFKAEFSGSLAQKVEIDYLFDGIVTLGVFDATDTLLGSVSAQGGFSPGTLTFTSAGYDVKWISVAGFGYDFGLLDNLRITVVPEPGAVGVATGLVALGFAWWRRRRA